MATSQRIYLVTTNDGKERLVKATQRQQALSHVANSLFTVKVASQDDLVKALTSGTQVEQYKQPDQMEIPE
jgi:phosphopantetheine adenylyltransferase